MIKLFDELSFEPVGLELPENRRPEIHDFAQMSSTEVLDILFKPRLFQ
ncbi:MAG: hypothetical protein AB7P76_09820 [Candidatus Melainabacteria bacterium]